MIETINCSFTVYNELKSSDKNLYHKFKLLEYTRNNEYFYKYKQVMMDMEWNDLNGSWINGHPQKDRFIVR